MNVPTHVLVIDTSSPAVIAAVVDVAGDPSLSAERITVDGKAHGELLAPSIRGCLTDADVSITAVVAGLGPGPFTGLRVGLVTAAAFGAAFDVPTYGVISLDGIADDTSLLVATDARRREIYWARYAGGRRIAGPEVGSPAAVRQLIEDDPPEAMAGVGARQYADVLGLPLLDRDHPSPLVLAGLAAERVRAGAAAEPLTPAYLRHPDAKPFAQR